MKYTVIIEEGTESFGAYVPDLPGCIAVAPTWEETLQLIQEAIEFHLDGMRENGEVIPAPKSRAEIVEVALAA